MSEKLLVFSLSMTKLHSFNKSITNTGTTYMLVSLLLLCIQTVKSQPHISGSITDEAGQGIPYVRLGIIGTSLQTMSDEQGRFSLQLPISAYSKDISFEAPGYQTRTIPAKDLRKYEETVVLKESVIRLKDVEVVNSRKVKKKVLGNRGLVSGYRRKSVNTQYLIAVNKKKSRPAFVSKIWIHVNQPEETQFTLRPLIYSADQSTGQPLQNLVDQNMIFKFTQSKGWVCLDLGALMSDVPDGKFFVGVEWIGNQNTQNQSSISLLLGGSADSYESTQLGKWKLIKGQGAFGIKTQLQYY